jgi:hypothetical protein
MDIDASPEGSTRPRGGNRRRFASRCDYWSDQAFVGVGAREAVIILPGGCRWHITLITSPVRSLARARAREESKATMHLGVKGNVGPYEDKRDPEDWPMKTDVARIIVRREEENKDGTKKEDTRGE